MKQKTVILTLLATVIALAILFGCSKKEAAVQAASGPVKLGGIFPLVAGEAGESMAHGVELAVEEKNAKGGLLGRQIIFTAEDDNNKPDVGISIFNKFEDEDVDAIFGPHSSAIGLAVDNTAKEFKRPVFTTGGSASIHERADVNPYFFCPRNVARTYCVACAEYAAKTFNFKKMGVINDMTWTRFYCDRWQQKYQELVPGSEFIFTEFTRGDTDFTAQIGKIMNTEGVLVVGWPNENALLGAQLKRMGYKGQVFCTSGNATYYFMNMAGTDCDGWIGETGYIYGVRDNPQAAAFEEAFLKKYGKPVTEVGAAFYDAANIYFAAVEKAGTTEPEAVRKALTEIKDLKCVQGDFKGFNPDGSPSFPHYIFKIVGNKYELLDRITTDYYKLANP
jgi:branched-chain amino acid transport system substrate-binding protein